MINIFLIKENFKRLFFALYKFLSNLMEASEKAAPFEVS